MPDARGDGGARPTLSDVAVLAGTSVPTVSKVLRGGTDVSPTMRRAVMAAVARVGYEPRRPHAHRAGAGAALLDFVISDVHGSWANQALGGVEGAATAAGLDLVLTIAREDGSWVERVLRRRSTGAVITLVDPTRAQLEALRAGRVPLVLIDPMSPAPPQVASVGTTNWEGGRSAAEHLRSLGHRRLGVVGGDAAHRYGQARVDGFRTGAGPAARVLPVEHADWRREDAAAAALRLLDRVDRPTAVFACSDLMAVGVYDAAQRLGLRIPRDLSVVGFDDLPEGAWASPPLTTVHQPIADLGGAAVRLLLRTRDAAAAAEAPREELATRLVVRASTAPPA